MIGFKTFVDRDQDEVKNLPTKEKKKRVSIEFGALLCMKDIVFFLNMLIGKILASKILFRKL